MLLLFLFVLVHVSSHRFWSQLISQFPVHFLDNLLHIASSIRCVPSCFCSWCSYWTVLRRSSTTDCEVYTFNGFSGSRSDVRGLLSVCSWNLCSCRSSSFLCFCHPYSVCFCDDLRDYRSTSFHLASYGKKEVHFFCLFSYFFRYPWCCLMRFVHTFSLLFSTL